MIENFNAIVKPKSYIKSRLMTHTQIWKWNEKIQRCVHKSNDTHASNRSRFLVKWIAIVNVWYKLARVPTLFQLCRLWLCHCVHGRSFSVVPPPFHFIAFCHCLVDEMKKKKKDVICFSNHQVGVCRSSSGVQWSPLYWNPPFFFFNTTTITYICLYTLRTAFLWRKRPCVALQPGESSVRTGGGGFPPIHLTSNCVCTCISIDAEELAS